MRTADAFPIRGVIAVVAPQIRARTFQRDLRHAPRTLSVPRHIATSVLPEAFLRREGLLRRGEEGPRTMLCCDLCADAHEGVSQSVDAGSPYHVVVRFLRTHEHPGRCPPT